MINYIVEGQCEEHLIKACSRMNLIKGGKVHVCNLWEKDVIRVLPKIQNGTKVITTVVDTDVQYGSKEVERYSSNIALLDSNYKVNEIKQNKNFEDAFIRACSKINHIDECFNTKGSEKFKKSFLKERNLERKLMEFGFDINKMWEL